MQGQYDDGNTGLYYNTFRYYDADAGRFTAEDPIGLSGGDNLYQYAPNPMAWVDPAGLALLPIFWIPARLALPRIIPTLRGLCAGAEAIALRFAVAMPRLAAAGQMIVDFASGYVLPPGAFISQYVIWGAGWSAAAFYVPALAIEGVSDIGYSFTQTRKKKIDLALSRFEPQMAIRFINSWDCLLGPSCGRDVYRKSMDAL
jgi:RHS repeat-associated protein